jgi:hypothetical protein
MCRPAKCRTCGGASWAGCGQHVDSVLAGVPAADRCRCDATTSAAAKPSLLQRLLRR